MAYQASNGFKRLSWFLVFLLVFTSIPLSTGAASPATGPFYLDNKHIDQAKTIDNPYPYNQPLITITGTYEDVDPDKLFVRVEQIVILDGKEKVIDPGYETRVTAVNQLKFEARNLSLYSGLNRITFIGYRGSTGYSNVFYIRYDNNPSLTELFVIDDGESIPLNSGFGVVVRSDVIYVEGKAPNATRVIVNGYDARLGEEGEFDSRVRLKPGRNDLVIEIINNTDRIQIPRTVYYVTEDQIVYETVLGINGKIYPLSFDKVTEVFADFINQDIDVTVSGKVFVPYSSGNNPPDITFDVEENQTPVQTSLEWGNNPQPVYAGSEIAYYAHTFTAKFTINRSQGGISRQFLLSFKGENAVNETVTNKFTVIVNNSNIPVVENVEWLVDYKPGDTDVNDNVKVPLDGATLNSSNIYILVTANQDITGKTVIMSGSDISLEDKTNGINISPNQRVFLMKQIPEGIHTVEFKIDDPNSDDRFNKRVQFTNASGPYITLKNLYDGMIIEGADREKLLNTIEGEIHNGPEVLKEPNKQYFWIKLNSEIQNFDWKVNPDGFIEFQSDLNEKAIFYGENKLELALDLNGDGNYEYQKTIRFYVLDRDLPVINAFKPVVKAKNYKNPRWNKDTFNQDDSGFEVRYKKLFNDSISNVNGVYYTQDREFDLLIDVTNADNGVLTYNGKNVIEFQYEDNDVKGNNVTFNNIAEGISGKNVEYYYDRGKDRLYIRIQGIEFTNPGSLIFILTVYNKGVKAEQRLEIVNETGPYRILSPVANTGDGKIVVNKNFVTIKIQANGADYVQIGKTRVDRSTEGEGTQDVFVYEYTGLKPNKENEIEFTIVRGNNKTKGSISVFYSNANVEGAAYKETMSSKHKVFGGALELSFPRGTVLRSEEKDKYGYNLFDNQQILFGIAHPEDGMVEKLFDNGDPRPVDKDLKDNFEKNSLPSHFTRISPIYWIHGGLATTNPDESRIHGLNPYDVVAGAEFVYTDYKDSKELLDEHPPLVPSQRGELKLKFDDNLRLAADHTVTVFYLNERGEWENIGGVVNTKNNTITVPFDRFGYYTVMKLSYSYDDIREHPWGKDVMEAAYSKGLMNNHYYDRFGANDDVTRGEFVQMLVKALSLPLRYDNNNTFDDVEPGEVFRKNNNEVWRYEYLETAARAGIVRGFDTKIFRPERDLTREEAAAMVARALELKLPKNDEKLKANLQKMFTDYDKIDYYARPAIYAVYKEGIMLGKQHMINNPGGNQKPTYYFAPNEKLTRAEAAAIVVRIMQKRKMLPDFLSDQQ